MYIMHPKEEFLLHLGQEQGISNIMSLEHIYTEGGCLGLPFQSLGRSCYWLAMQARFLIKPKPSLLKEETVPTSFISTFYTSIFNLIFGKFMKLFNLFHLDAPFTHILISFLC